MTTSVTIKNHGPGKVRVRHRNISLSARATDRDDSEVALAAGEETPHAVVYDTRKIIIEEVIE